MKKTLLFLSICLLIYMPLFAQQGRERSLSVIVSADYDKYKFNSIFSEHPVHLSGHGLSKGIGLLYEKRYFEHWAFDLGIGYYQYSFNILRNINYFDPENPILILYSTKKYYYNCLSLSTTFNYIKSFKNGYLLRGGIGYTYYYTFSQKYQISGGTGGTWKKAYSYPFANSIYLTTGLEKSIGNYGVGFFIHFLLWGNWRKDNEAFWEIQYKRKYHNKTDHGIGIGIKGNYYF